jgi:hypothetical protein
MEQQAVRILQPLERLFDRFDRAVAARRKIGIRRRMAQRGNRARELAPDAQILLLQRGCHGRSPVEDRGSRIGDRVGMRTLARSNRANQLPRCPAGDVRMPRSTVRREARAPERMMQPSVAMGSDPCAASKVTASRIRLERGAVRARKYPW